MRNSLSPACAALCLLLMLWDAVAADEASSSGGSLDHLRRFDVQVVDIKGNPISGAQVTPWALRCDQGHGRWRTPGDNPKDPPTVTTDDQGRATVSYPELAGYEESTRVTSVSCRVSHNDFADTAYNNVAVPAVGTTPVEMERGALVKLGGLVEGALIANDDLYAMWSSPGAAGYEVSRAEPGFVVLPRLTAGPQKLRLIQITKDGLARFSDVQQLDLQNDQEYPLLLDLQQAAKVAGRLSDNVPRPVKQGRVVASVVSPRQNEDDYETIAWATWAQVEEDGTFALDALPPGEHLQLTALCEGFFAAGGEPPEFATRRERQQQGYIRPQVFKLVEQENRVTLTMQPLGRVEVTVVEGGEPLVGVTVAACPNVGWWSGGSQIYCHPLYTTKDWLLNPGPFRANSEIPHFAFTDERGAAMLSLPVRQRPTTTIYLSQGEDYSRVVGDEDGYRVVLKSGGTISQVIDVSATDPVTALEDAAQRLFRAGEQLRESLSE